MDPTASLDGAVEGALEETVGGGTAQPGRAPGAVAAPARLIEPRGETLAIGESARQVVRRLTHFLAVGMVGIVVMLAGLVWDAVAHARDPELVHSEGNLFTLSSPSHAVLLLGGALAMGGLTAATVRALSLSAGRRLSSPRTGAVVAVGTLVMVAATAGGLRWASTAQPPIATGPLAPSQGPDTHGIGIVNSHAPGPCRATNSQKAGAAKLIADTQTGTARYRSLAAAQADGYVGPANPTLTEHYVKLTYTQDGRVLDPARPEALMYTPTAKGMVLVGVMYLMNVPGEFGPEPGGCLTRWHVHANVCFNAAFQAVSELQAPGEACPDGAFRYVPPPALHVWFLDVPGGRFAPEVDAKFLAKAVGP